MGNPGLLGTGWAVLAVSGWLGGQVWPQREGHQGQGKGSSDCPVQPKICIKSDVMDSDTRVGVRLVGQEESVRR